jgi:subtilisin family serine protease
MQAVLVDFTIPDRREATTVVSLLKQHPGVLEADVDSVYRVQGEAPAQFQYAPQVLGATRVHSALQGRGILIAIVDTGIDATHEALRGAIAKEENLVEGDQGTRAETHGTAEAGIIAARPIRGGGGISGIAAEARIIALRACVPDKPGSVEATCLAHRVAHGIDLAVQYHVQIINLSLGGPPNRIVDRLVLQAIFVHGIAVVAAGTVGPDGRPLYPAAVPGVISAGATDAHDRLYHSYEVNPSGLNPSILAPGVDIMTTLPGNRYGFVTGASFAAANVSGSLALLMEAKRSSTVSELEAALRDGAKPVPGASAGRIDLCHSLEIIRRPVCG